MKTFSVIVPVYFNQDSLLPLAKALDDLEAELAKRSVALEIIFVNDGSRDASLERLREIKARRPATIVMSHLANCGSMAAIKTGLARATGDAFTYLAADLQDPPDLLPEMIDLWLAGERFVVRTRAGRKDPFLTKIFAWLNYRLVRMLVMSTFPPGGYDMAVWDKAFQPHMLRCGRNKNLALFAWSLGVPAKILSYQRQEREHGKSMWSFRKKVNYFIDSTIGFSVRPLRLVSGFGLLLALGCFIYTVVVVAGRLFGFIEVPGFATLAALIGFLQGCGFLMMGLLGEYVWRIYTEINQHPEALVEEITVT